MIKLIVAHDINKVIGKDNILPWSIKEELLFYRDTTIHHAILMGRSTFSGIGHVLKDRKTYILTRDETFNFVHDNVEVINDAQKLMEKYQNSEEILFISGGASIYEQFYKYADELIISTIKNEYDGDAYFVDIDYTKYDILSTKDFNDFCVNTYQKK